jgi:hypothetical protein
MNEPLAQLAPTEPVRDERKDAPAPVNPPQRLTGMAKWVHEHRDVTTKPVGHMTYQVIRNLMAAVPYAIATILTWSGFERLNRYANNKLAAAKTLGDAGKKSSYFWEGLGKFARSPIKDIAMIAAGFTLYRGTLRMVRYTKERLFNPNHTEDETRDEVQNFDKHLGDTFKEVAPAEINSTPYGAIALGLGRRYVNGIAGYADRKEYGIGQAPLGQHAKAQTSVFRNAEGKLSFGKENWKTFANKVFHSKSMPFAEAAVFITAFLTFFEISDRLFKDVQVRRGVWRGEDNALLRTQPEDADKRDAAEKKIGLDKDEDYQLGKHRGQHTKVFGGDPNLGRLLMTRVLSTTLGIGAYTFTKRAAYASMGHFTSVPTFTQKALIEGLATATFFVMTTSNDVIEGLYKKHILKPQEKTSLQQQKHDELLVRLNEKYKGNSVAV